MEEYLYVADSPIHGKGLFAAKNIPADAALFITGYLKPLLYAGKYPMTNAWILMKVTDLCKLVNHSPNANTAMVQDGNVIWLFSLREIKAGEELTADYERLPHYYNRDVTGFIL